VRKYEEEETYMTSPLSFYVMHSASRIYKNEDMTYWLKWPKSLSLISSSFVITVSEDV
jgi:hypothetical protein